MISDGENSFVTYHENVFESANSHVVIHLNTQNSNYSTHWHSPMEIIMPTENNYTAFVNNSEIFLRPGDILLIAPNINHSYLAPETGSRYFFLLDLSVLKDIRGFQQITAFMNPSVLITPESHPEICSRVKEILLSIYNTYTEREMIPLPGSLQSPEDTMNTLDISELTIYHHLSEILLLIAKHAPKTITRNTNGFAKNKKQEYLNRFTSICNYIDTHCSEFLTLDRIAEHANFSKFHFSRLFKEFTGESFYHYVNRKRIEYACDLLINQNLTITEIALASGYSSNSIFIRMFKQFHNCTPKEFRIRNRKVSK